MLETFHLHKHLLRSHLEHFLNWEFFSIVFLAALQSLQIISPSPRLLVILISMESSQSFILNQFSVLTSASTSPLPSTLISAP